MSIFYFLHLGSKDKGWGMFHGSQETGSRFLGFPGDVSRAQDEGDAHLDAKGQRRLISL